MNAALQSDETGPRPFAPPEAYSEAAGQGSPGTIKPGPPFDLVLAADMTFTDPAFVIAGLLETETLAAIFGKPGACKTFVALDMACCVAAGVPYHGRDVLQGAVIYIAGEGHNGIKRRLVAWERHNGASLADAPLHVSKRAANLPDPAAVEAVIAAIDRVARAGGDPPRLVIVDTVARNFGAGDENKTQDMGAFVAGVDSIKHRFPGCSVLLVHHTGHGEGDRARGSSVLIGALDAEFRAETVDGTTTLTCTKMKEAAEPAPIAFKAHTIEIGRTKAGEALTSLALEEVAAPAKTRGRMSPANRRALETFHRAKRDAGLGDDIGAGVHVDDWRSAFYAASTADNPHAKKVAFHRARTSLVEAGDLAVTDGVYRLARLPEAKQ